MYERKYMRVDIDSILSNLSAKYRLSQDVMKLVEMDLCSGMTKEQVMKYCTKSISVGRMKVISDCIRKGCDVDVIKKLSADERSDEVMEVVFELLDKGVKLADFEDKLDSRERLLDFLNEYVEKLNDDGRAQVSESDKEVVPNSSPAIENNTSIEEIRKEYDEKLSHTEMKLMDILKAWERDNEERLKRVIDQIRIDAEKKSEHQVKNDGINDGKNDRLNNVSKADSDMSFRTLSVKDSDGRIICSLPVEQSVKKSSALGGIASTLGFKKKSKKSLMQLAINGELSKEQLVHIVDAMKSGLTENQLCNLIENKVPAERMPQIIRIAILENQMGYNG